jgi:hypothetical protein
MIPRNLLKPGLECVFDGGKVKIIREVEPEDGERAFEIEAEQDEWQGVALESELFDLSTFDT